MPSTVIRYFRYNATERELHVTFVTGRQYVYEDVPPDVFEAFRGAFSKGTFLIRKIRNCYRYREVTHEYSS